MSIRPYGALALALAAVASACSKDALGPGQPEYTIAFVSGSPQTGSVTAPFAAPVLIAVTEGTSSHPAANVSVHWSAQGVLPRDTTLKTDAAGRVSIMVVADTIAGVAGVAAAAGDMTSTSSMTVEPGPVARADALPDSIRAAADGLSLSAVFRDRYGNVIARSPSFSSSDTTVVATPAGTPVVRHPGVSTVTLKLDSVRVSTRVVIVGWKQVGAGWNATCGVTSDGRLFCWGSGPAGILGTATTEKCDVGATGSYLVDCATSPLAVMPNRRFTMVRMAQSFACALDSTGAAWCWGDNRYAQLGAGYYGPITAPAPVAGGHTFKTLALGRDFACGMESSGQTWCWGNGFMGLGDGVARAGLPTDSVHTPVPVVYYPFRTIVSNQGKGMCGLLGDGSAMCWGGLFDHADGIMALGYGHNAPVAWGAPQKFDILDYGNQYGYCGIRTGDAFCWGANDQGQLGIGSTDAQNNPTKVTLPTSAVDVSMGVSTTCAVGADGAAYCWGSNVFKSLGVQNVATTCRAEKYECSMVPVQVSNSTGLALRSVTVGAGHACAIAENGLMYCWGFGLYGQTAQSDRRSLAAATKLPTPVTVGPTSAAFVAARAGFTANVSQGGLRGFSALSEAPRIKSSSAGVGVSRIGVGVQR